MFGYFAGWISRRTFRWISHTAFLAEQWISSEYPPNILWISLISTSIRLETQCEAGHGLLWLWNYYSWLQKSESTGSCSLKAEHEPTIAFPIALPISSLCAERLIRSQLDCWQQAVALKFKIYETNEMGWSESGECSQRKLNESPMRAKWEHLMNEAYSINRPFNQIKHSDSVLNRLKSHPVNLVEWRSLDVWHTPTVKKS